jgi:hypothetical protein
MSSILNLQLEKYFVMTIVCPDCGFRFPLPERVEMELQPGWANFENLLSLDMALPGLYKDGLGLCPSCGQPTILQIRAINKNG